MNKDKEETTNNTPGQEEPTHQPFKPSAAQLAKWNKEYPQGIFIIKAKDPNDGKEYHGYFKNPDRNIMFDASAHAKGSMLKFNQVLFAQCWIGGDEIIKTKDSLYMGAVGQIGDAAEVASTELVKL